ncbi:putative inactive histone-lysine N-methyltransferase SUVR2 isoform X2 [Canna indica]|uniref:Inactive histone-lysine N-methyltransferase SUVR2 isoform X2 n=1 Tax=Canna indica TaxID=4628 RepID=A0AAQ3JSU6_9LILI|nr:putative inactive histone-lysine N-methyltransferase SUVR2 isoform X2 [Canna indica]
MTKARAIAAVNAMKAMGIPVEKVKTVLRNLLQVYENNWEYIEAENYRVLADAIFEWEESQDNVYAGKAVESDELQYRRPRARYRQDDHPLSPLKATSHLAGETSLKRPRLEADVSFKGVSERDTGISSERAGRTSPHIYLKEKKPLNQTGEACQALVPYRKDKQPTLEKMEKKHNRDTGFFNLVRPKDEPCDYISPVFETPIAMIPPSQPFPSGKIGHASNHGSLKSYSNLQNINMGTTRDVERKNDESCFVDACNKVTAPVADSARNKAATSEILSVQESSSRSTVDIASSDLGEVKLTFSCSSDRPNFHIPNLESVFKQVEDKCLKSYKILEPSFSLANLMKEMCQCYRDLSYVTTGDKQENSLQIIPTVDSVEQHTVEQDNQNEKNKKMKKAKYLVQSQHTLAELGPPHDINDISKGEENVRISVLNELTKEKYPPTFHYIPRNIVHQNAYVNFSLARIGDENCCADCFSNCLAAPVPCACARETGGVFAYTSGGLITKEFLDEYISMTCEPKQHNFFYCKDCPLERSKNEISTEACKGHLVRKFIKECWSKCGCSMHCGNRVVQRGIMHQLQVFFTSKTKGWGLRTLENLPRGAFVCEYVGEVLTNTELYDRTMQTTRKARHTYPVLLDADWGSEGTLKDEEALCLDATFYGNVARFINHRCFDANLIGIPVEVELPDHHYYHLSFFTTRKVDAFEELTWDYGIDFADIDHPVKAFRCACGSKFCRDNHHSTGPSEAV